ncbi:MAG: hypothetical protein ACOY46_08705 [Bacillota bacterium]
MKKYLMLGFTVLLLSAALPAMAGPNENASPQAFQAQNIKICREMMKDAVKAGDMTKDQLKACIEMARTAPCTGMEE